MARRLYTHINLIDQINVSKHALRRQIAVDASTLNES